MTQNGKECPINVVNVTTKKMFNSHKNLTVIKKSNNVRQLT